MPIILMRNLDFSQGLANGTRLIVMHLGTHLIKAKIMSGADQHVGTVVNIPRIPLKPSDTDRMPVPFTRKQVSGDISATVHTQIHTIHSDVTYSHTSSHTAFCYHTVDIPSTGLSLMVGFPFASSCFCSFPSVPPSP